MLTYVTQVNYCGNSMLNEKTNMVLHLKTLDYLFFCVFCNLLLFQT